MTHYTAVDDPFQNNVFETRSPRLNRDGETRSAKSKKTQEIQFGDVDQQQIAMISSTSSSMTFKILDDTILQCIESMEESMIQYVAKNFESWFGKQFEDERIRRMLGSIVKRDEIAIAANHATCYAPDDNGETIVKVDKLPDHPVFVVPILKFKGIYFARRRFSIVLEVTSVLIGDEYVTPAPMPESMLQDDDLSDPMALNADDDDTQQSFGGETHMFGC